MQLSRAVGGEPMPRVLAAGSPRLWLTTSGALSLLTSGAECGGS